VSVGFEVNSDVVSLRGVVEVFDSGRNACHRNVSLLVSSRSTAACAA
jgi:hypothetical protein